jgi:RecA/RadA recombinase
VKHFNTGVEELDKLLGESGLSSDELVEVSGQSGAGKTYFCLKMVSLALLEKDVAAIYVDTSNYVNADNINLCVKNFMNDSDHKAKADRAQETLGRLRVIKIFNLDELLVLLAMILEQLRSKKLTFDLRLIVIDSLSSLFAPVPHKQHQYF